MLCGLTSGDWGALQCSCLPVRDAPGGGIDSLEEAGFIGLGLEGITVPFWEAPNVKPFFG